MNVTQSKKRYGIKFSIPDAPVKEQLRQLKSIRKIMLTLAKATGETNGLDLTDIDTKIANLEEQVKTNEHIGGKNE